MSRFVNADLSALGAIPAVVPVDYASIKGDRTALLKASYDLFQIPYDVETLETDPDIVVGVEAGGTAEMLLRQRVNEAISALSLATGLGGSLDHIAATYYGISRQSEIDERGAVIVEDDERFRDRIALAPEAFSTAGPLGAYVFHALELDGEPDIADAWAYSEEDAATYSAGLRADAFSMGAAGRRRLPGAPPAIRCSHRKCCSSSCRRSPTALATRRCSIAPTRLSPRGTCARSATTSGSSRRRS